MRWTDTVTLVSREMTQDEYGAWHQGDPVETTVFCNRRTLGGRRRSDAVDVGMRAEAEVEVRTCDYAGQTEVVYLGETYDAEPTWHGDFTYLTLGRRVADEHDGD